MSNVNNLDVNKKKQGMVLIIGMFGIMILFSLCFVFADPIALFSSGDATFVINEDVLENVINISVNNTNLNDADANISQVNVSFHSNLIFTALSNVSSSAVPSTFLNTSTVLSWNVDNLTSNGSIEYFAFNLTGQIPGSYTLNVTTVNGTGTYNLSVTLTVNDTNSSDVNYGSLTVADGGSVSQNFIYVNVSMTQYNEDAVVFELHNLTGGLLNRTTKGANNRTINWTSGLGDGGYIYNVTVNDTFGNSDTSSRTIYLDTTNPVATASCDSSDYAVSGAITCTCTATDNVDASPAVTASSYSTSVAGDFTYYCNASDNVPNNHTASDTYSVYAGSGTPSTTSGGSTITTTKVVSVEDFEEGVTNQVAKNEQLKFKVSNVDHTLAVNEVTTSTVKITIASDSQIANLKVGDLRKFDVSDDGYYDLSVKLESIESSKANITILSIHELLTNATADLEKAKEQEAAGINKEEAEAEADAAADGTEGVKSNIPWVWILLIILIVIIGGAVWAGWKYDVIGFFKGNNKYLKLS